MLSSDVSGQTRLASDESGWRTCWEQVADKVRKQQEQAAVGVNGGSGRQGSVVSKGEASIDKSIFCVPPPL